MNSRVGILLTDTALIAAILRRRGRTWRILRRHQVEISVPATLQEDTLLDEIADAIQEAVSAVDGLGLPAHLIVPSTWCFHHTLDEATRRFNATAAAFELEEFLPLPLEALTCAFGAAHRHRRVGVAIRTKPVRHLLDRLGRNCISIKHVYPDACVAVASHDGNRNEAGGLLLLDDHRAIVHLRDPADQTPSVLRTALRAPDTSANTVVALSETVAGFCANRWAVLDLRSDNGPGVTPVALDSAAEVELILRSDAVTQLQLATVEHAAQLPDLCNAALAPAGRWDQTMLLASRCAVLLTVVLLVWAGDLYWCKSDYQDAGGDARTRQIELFSKALPGCKMPFNPALRLASERIRLEGLTRTRKTSGGNLAEPQDRYAAIDALRSFAAALPADLRVLLLDWNVDGNHLSIRGQTADHGDAERIAEVVNKLPGLIARPPRTSRLKAGGVDFTIRASRRDQEPQRHETLADAR